MAPHCLPLLKPKETINLPSLSRPFSFASCTSTTLRPTTASAAASWPRTQPLPSITVLGSSAQAHSRGTFSFSVLCELLCECICTLQELTTALTPARVSICEPSIQVTREVARSPPPRPLPSSGLRLCRYLRTAKVQVLQPFPFQRQMRIPDLTLMTGSPMLD